MALDASRPVAMTCVLALAGAGAGAGGLLLLLLLVWRINHGCSCASRCVSVLGVCSSPSSLTSAVIRRSSRLGGVMFGV